MGDHEAEQAQLRGLLAETFAGEDSILYDDDESDIEEAIDESRTDTDTEQDIDSDSDISDVDSDTQINPEVYRGKDGTTWYKNCNRKMMKTTPKNIVIHLPGSRGAARFVKEPFEIWKIFFNDKIMNIIVENTNQYLANKSPNYSRNTYMRPTNIPEIQALLGILLLSGVKKSNHLNADDLFKTNGTVPEIYRLAMSCQRFRILLRHLRFDDLKTRKDRISVDRLSPIRDLFEEFVENCRRNYCMSNFVTIDEKLEGFRGRCCFRQYIPSKPKKYGIKIYALCDAKMYYTANLEVYVGKQPEGPFSTNNSALSVVERLCEPIQGTGRNLTTDNWFTSLELAESLLKKKITLVGTIRKNKRCLPVEFTNNKSRPVGSSLFGFSKNCTLVSYIPKRNKNVLLISTKHYDDSTGIDDATGKPIIITDYNSTKGGVDTVDQLCANYNCARNSRRWQIVIFYSLLNISAINAEVIFHTNNPEDKTLRRHFLEKLSFALMESHLKARAYVENIPRTTRERIFEICNLERHNPQSASNKENTTWSLCLL